MTRNPLAMTRRRIVGGALAAAAFPFAVRGQDGRDPASQEPTDVRIRMTFNDVSLTATLYDNPSARDFASMLPLNLKIEDFGGNEKIVHLPRKLTEDGGGPFGNEGPATSVTSSHGGNLTLFYDAYRWDGLIRLGRFDGRFEPLLVRGAYPVSIERI
jgi:hypothetical protein